MIVGNMRHMVLKEFTKLFQENFDEQVLCKAQVVSAFPNQMKQVFVRNMPRNRRSHINCTVTPGITTRQYRGSASRCKISTGIMRVIYRSAGSESFKIRRRLSLISV